MQRLLFAYIVNPKDIEIFRKAQDIQIRQFPIYNETTYAFSTVNGLVPTIRTFNTGHKFYDKANVAEYAFKFAKEAGFQYVAYIEPNMIITGRDNIDPHGKVQAYRMSVVECTNISEINKLYRGGMFTPKKEELSADSVYVYNVENKTLNVNNAAQLMFTAIKLVEKAPEVVVTDPPPQPKTKFVKK